MFYYEHTYDHSYRWVQPPVGPRYIIIYYFVRGPAGTLHVPDIGPGERADIMDEKKALLCSTSITRSECVLNVYPSPKSVRLLPILFSTISLPLRQASLSLSVFF